jgi:hypothetical protein
MVLVALLAPRIARRLGEGTFAVWLWLTSVVGFLSVTATPSDLASWQGDRGLSFVFQLTSINPAELLDFYSAKSLNVWICVPMGLFTTWVALRSSRHFLILVPLFLPAIAELWQYAVPALGRSGFFLDDVLLNEIGVVLGIFAGATAVIASRLFLGVSDNAPVAPEDSAAKAAQTSPSD